MQHEIMEADVLIVGAGPAGLSAAIRLAQHAKNANLPLSIFVLEKGAAVGAHILSGAAIETRALDELIPDWKQKDAPVKVEVTEDVFCLMTKKHAIRLPTPPTMKNPGNYIISLGRFTQWLAAQAEALGVQIMPGFAGAKPWIENDALQGVITGEFGVAKSGERKPSYQPGVAIKARYTLIAEGCRGSLAEQLIKHFNLRADASPQTYGIGIKELWEVPPEKHQRGRVVHTIGWPLDWRTYGGSFLYHADHNQIAIGLITGLDYRNPYLDPYQEFQRFKSHPYVRPLLEGGRRLCYGSRALNEGGLQSLPKLVFPGGALIGDAAGFLNVPKIKGTHAAMKSGMLAAEAIWESWSGGERTLTRYPDLFKQSWLYKELYRARNIRPSFRWGLVGGLTYSAIDTYLLRGRAPWTLKYKHGDHQTLIEKNKAKRIAYPPPDGIVTFDRMSSVYLSNTHHEEDQPSHLKLLDPSIPVRHNLALFDAPEQRYCPAGVYEIVQRDGSPALQINAANCVHCKTCDIKDPLQNILWLPPEGSGGPNYEGM